MSLQQIADSSTGSTSTAPERGGLDGRLGALGLRVVTGVAAAGDTRPSIPPAVVDLFDALDDRGQEARFGNRPSIVDRVLE